jgi:hypothetical protein
LTAHDIDGHSVGRLVRRVFVGGQTGKRPQGEVQSTSWIKPLKETVSKPSELGEYNLPLLSGCRFIDPNPGFSGGGYRNRAETLMMATNAPGLIEEYGSATLHGGDAGLDHGTKII